METTSTEKKTKLTNQIKAQQWKDETGIEVAAARIMPSEKLREKTAYSLAVTALKINELLLKFKDDIQAGCEAINEAVRKDALLKERPKKDTKGNFTWYNFDRSIKVECNLKEQIQFDDVLISLCQEKLNEFLNRSLSGSENALMIKDLVHDAFNNTKGRLDAKKVMSLLRYEGKIESILYTDAMNFLKQSIRRPDSKLYYAVSIRDEQGAYQLINLNFSSI